ncbi:Urea transporter [Pandoraea captiosa]|uniref:Urea transporter n=2 Tax=Pandoraea captiosa TaxID=2508302 RepID=A0A5E5A672_9BURK|nr:Urea transporter [Pandoraea captiosa]
MGALLLAVLALADLATALTGFVASVAASVCAIALRLAPTQRRSGLLGYNAALTGVAFAALWQPNETFATWLAICVGMNVILTAALARYRVPALTGPFVAVMTLSWAMQYWLPLTPRPGTPGCDAGAPGFVFCSVGQVIFMAPLVLGLLTWYLLALWNARATLWALASGAAIWAMLSVLTTVWPALATQAGGIGVNAFLAALGLGVFGRHPNVRLVGAALAAVICIALGHWLAPSAWPYFTLPFNLAVWTVLALTKRPGQTVRT